MSKSDNQKEEDGGYTSQENWFGLLMHYFDRWGVRSITDSKSAYLLLCFYVWILIYLKFDSMAAPERFIWLLFTGLVIHFGVAKPPVPERQQVDEEREKLIECVDGVLRNDDYVSSGESNERS